MIFLCISIVVVSIYSLGIIFRTFFFPLLVTDLEWKLIYVGSAEDETYDQLLESVLVGPVNVGNYRFVLQVLIHWSSSDLSSI